MSVFPPEIINEILLRLPVNPLLRFRSVSKPWCAQIDDPDFIKRHLKRSITTKLNRSLYLGGTGTLFSLDFTELRTAIELEIPFRESDGADILGSCDGILLLQRKDVTLFNPATRQYRILPSSPIEYPSCHVSSSFEKYGFGYDSVNNDYKVIRVVEFKGMGFRWISSEAKIFSLKSNSWRKIEKFPYSLPYKRVWGVHLNGRLHTVVNTSSDANSPEIIVAFNLGTEKCHFIPLPDGLDKSYFDISVEVFEGCLCVLATYEGYRTDIWVMRVYGVKELWVKLLTIGPPLVKPYTTIYPLAFSKNGTEVLLNFDDKRLIWYDRERKSVRRAPFRALSYPFYTEVGVESLVPLDSAGRSDGFKKEVKLEKAKEVKVERPKVVEVKKPKEVQKEKQKEVNEEKQKNKKNKKRDGFLSEGFKLKL